MEIIESKPLIVDAGHRYVIITGDVVEDVTRDTSFETKGSKVFKAFADNVPYPPGMQTVTCSIRVAQHPANEMSPRTDVIVKGDLQPRPRKGDTLQIVAREERRILGLFNVFNLFGECVGYTAVPSGVRNYSSVRLRAGEQVESAAIPGASIPAGLVQFLPMALLLIALLAVVWLAFGGAGAIVDGLAGIAVAIVSVVLDLLLALLYALGPSLFVIVGIAMLVRSVMR